MSDQTVRISNFPSSSSKERVAWDLFNNISSVERQEGQKRGRKEILDLYAECLQATSGLRDI
jgi:hypothetical protein